MKRSQIEIIGDILSEIAKNPNLAPTRATQKAGVTYDKLQPLITQQLITLQQTGKKRRSLSLTEKGRKYLQHYQALTQLQPSHHA